ncbi:MAG: SDR family NAD(P)-dependent oxidoreductase, partial [Gammaproteobacteria bacterium]
MRRFDGKVAVVVGGGGIGGASACRLAAEGARVVVGDLQPEAARSIGETITAAGGEALGMACDIVDPVSVKALFAAAVARFGGIDAVHVNAADLQVIFQDSNAVEVSLEVFERTLAVGLRGHLLCTQVAIPLLLARGGGAIVYTTSTASYGGEPERPCYAMAKAGVNALMRHVASRW